MDTSSTQAELGSPHHTNSFSTINSASTLPPASQSGPSAGRGQHQPQPPSQTREPGQRIHQPVSHHHEDFILYPAADEEEYADSQAPQEQVPGQDSPHQQNLPTTASSSNPVVSGTRVQGNDHNPPRFQPNGSGTSSPPQPVRPVQPRNPPHLLAPLETRGEQQPSEVAAVQQWGTPPWSMLSPVVGAGGVHPSDRNFRDKMEEDLEKLGNAATHSDVDDEETQQNGEKKVGKGKKKGKGKKRRGTRSPSRDTDRQNKRPRGGGDDGNGISV
ncbi:hypothetical protein L207DRAFT_532956 [Hyaloscypha variabilis F]|uniref:Uncharacterized protein n=1 Tax=Hyaloscypha variabilis (strain UAMH 11265 / GT02V1 / F) TaxID=1149755 RepID=A0A2J6RC37_HYAVF|nr:hypothetical protein L207DRAFT_532956 [Hyaloscypha variabilis F]